MSTAAQLLPILEFRYRTDKGATKVGDLVLDATWMGKTDPEYNSRVIINQPLATADNYWAPFTPIDAGIVKIILASGDVISDNGDETLSDGGQSIIKQEKSYLLLHLLKEIKSLIHKTMK